MGRTLVPALPCLYNGRGRRLTRANPSYNPFYHPWLTSTAPVSAMARARYPDDPNRAELEVRASFEEEQTAAYSREDELYGP